MGSLALAPWVTLKRYRIAGPSAGVDEGGHIQPSAPFWVSSSDVSLETTTCIMHHHLHPTASYSGPNGFQYQAGSGRVLKKKVG